MQEKHAGKTTLDTKICTLSKIPRIFIYLIVHAFRTKYLSQKQVGYLGSISIDHDSREIQIFVKKYSNTADKEETRKQLDELMWNKKLKSNTSSLSGGERSISTVMFLISLWKSSSSPFR